MDFSLDRSIVILQNTPQVLRSLLVGVHTDWVSGTEGGDTWSAYDVVGHLIHGERTDWIQRLEIILEHGETRPFTPFDRFAQFEESKGKDLSDLLDTFDELRAQNLRILRSKLLTTDQLTITGTHPVFGSVTLQNLIATWTVHDFTHLSQIVRVMAHQYREHVGPWEEYLSVLKPRV